MFKWTGYETFRTVWGKCVCFYQLCTFLLALAGKTSIQSELQCNIWFCKNNSLKYAGYFRLRGCAQNQDTGMSRQILMTGKDDVTWSQVKNSWQMQPIKVKGAVLRSYQNSNRGNRHKTEYSMKITAHNKKITQRMQREPNNRQTWRRLKNGLQLCFLKTWWPNTFSKSMFECLETSIDANLWFCHWRAMGIKNKINKTTVTQPL